jgi:methylmalonyl-CoA carboxyltransferase large subunit
MAVNVADLIRALSDRQLATERRLGELASAVKALQARVTELDPSAAMQTAIAPAIKMRNADGGAKEVATSIKGEVTPEVLVLIAAAVTAFLGKKVRVRSANMLQSPYEVVNPWSQQGRVFVQASHNLRSRS